MLNGEVDRRESCSLLELSQPQRTAIAIWKWAEPNK